MMLPYHFRDRTGGVVMVSSSRDGDIIADTVDRFGMRAVRGSSRHGGRQALDLMIDAVRGGNVSAGVIVDGPRGPARVAKSGAVLLARATGLPIVPGDVVGAAARPGRLVGPDDRAAAVLAHRLRLRRAPVRAARRRPRRGRGGAGGAHPPARRCARQGPGGADLRVFSPRPVSDLGVPVPRGVRGGSLFANAPPAPV